MMADGNGGCWPTPRQQLLLRAALLNGQEAIDAWEAWIVQTDVDRLDWGSQRLLPMLYRNLDRLGISDPLMEKFKGVYRQVWYRNNLRIYKLAPLVQLFQNSGIPVLLIKGSALALLYYKDVGLRPMDDLDIMVPVGHAEAAAEMLIREGWRSRSRIMKKLFEIRHSAEFHNQEGIALDLHWHALLQCCQLNADEDFWSAAVPVSFNGAESLTLDPADHLLHVCVHGAEWNPVPPIRWVADSVVIINSTGGELNWSRLVSQAKKRQLVGTIRQMFAFLRDVMGAPIPQALMDELWSIRVSRTEQLIHRYITSPPSPGDLLVKWHLHSRAAAGQSLARRLIGYPRYLQYYWDLDSLWQIPGYILNKVRQRRSSGSDK